MYNNKRVYVEDPGPSSNDERILSTITERINNNIGLSFELTSVIECKILAIHTDDKACSFVPPPCEDKKADCLVDVLRETNNRIEALNARLDYIATQMSRLV